MAFPEANTVKQHQVLDGPATASNLVTSQTSRPERHSLYWYSGAGKPKVAAASWGALGIYDLFDWSNYAAALADLTVVAAEAIINTSDAQEIRLRIYDPDGSAEICRIKDSAASTGTRLISLESQTLSLLPSGLRRLQVDYQTVSGAGVGNLSTWVVRVIFGDA